VGQGVEEMLAAVCGGGAGPFMAPLVASATRAVVVNWMQGCNVFSIGSNNVCEPEARGAESRESRERDAGLRAGCAHDGPPACCAAI
jgi:hypothetical protein